MSPQRIFQHTLNLQMSDDATPEMRAWFEEHRTVLLAGIAERIEPKLIQLLKMEVNNLGFSKAFPLEKELG